MIVGEIVTVSVKTGFSNFSSTELQETRRIEISIINIFFHLDVIFSSFIHNHVRDCAAQRLL